MKQTKTTEVHVYKLPKLGMCTLHDSEARASSCEGNYVHSVLQISTNKSRCVFNIVVGLVVVRLCDILNMLISISLADGQLIRGSPGCPPYPS